MSLPLFVVDAFTDRAFAGNPAAVCLLPGPDEDAWMRQVAAEMNLSETAFLLRDNGDYRLRWFTPETEVPLCGHATLASAAVVMERLEPARTRVVFHSASGPLTRTRDTTSTTDLLSSGSLPERGSQPHSPDYADFTTTPRTHKQPEHVTRIIRTA